MELKGTVTLDEKTMEELREHIREEVINDIKEGGNYFNEIEKYLNDCDFETYMQLIINTLDGVIERTKDEDIRFNSDEKTYNRLLAIKSILNI